MSTLAENRLKKPMTSGQRMDEAFLKYPNRTNENSADYHFLLSLVPSIEKVPDEQKLALKIDILNNRIQRNRVISFQTFSLCT